MYLSQKIGMLTFLALTGTGAATAQVVEVAEKGLGILERIQAGGVLLISLVVATICGAGFYWQLRENKKLTQDALKEAKDREATRLKDQADLLREMIDRDREASEVASTSAKAVEGITVQLAALTKSVESGNLQKDQMARRQEQILHRIDELDRLVRQARA